MLHDVLARMVLDALRADPDISPHMGVDGAVSLHFEGGIFSPGSIDILVPEGCESAAGNVLLGLDRTAQIPVFVGVAAMGQPTGLSRTHVRLRLDPVEHTPGRARAPFVLEMGF